MITSFNLEAERMAKRARRRVLKERERSENGYSSTSSSDYGYSTETVDTDEEYFKIIAGEEPEESEEGMTPEEKARMAALRAAFAEADKNFDGTLSLNEVKNMQSFLFNNAGGTGVASNERLEKLEKQVAANSQKLDQILKLLGNGK